MRHGMWRLLLTCAGLAAVLAAPAQAALRWDFSKKPDYVHIDGPPGVAVAICAASAKGLLSGCQLALAEPIGSNVGAQLLASASSYEMKPRPKACARKLDKVVISTSRPAVAVGANWLQRPTLEDVMSSYPPVALAKRQRASIALACEVSAGGQMEACRGLFVDGAPNAGFEAAAESLAAIFRLTPAFENGKPVRGHAVVPINFYPVRPPC